MSKKGPEKMGELIRFPNAAAREHLKADAAESARRKKHGPREWPPLENPELQLRTIREQMLRGTPEIMAQFEKILLDPEVHPDVRRMVLECMMSIHTAHYNKELERAISRGQWEIEI